MEGPERMDAQSQLQESGRPPHRLSRWLGWLAHRAGLASEDESAMSGHNGHKNGNGSDPAKTAPATASGSQSGSGDTLEFDVPDWRTASFVTVSALSVVLPIESRGKPPSLTDAQKRAREEDINAVIAAGHAQPPV